MWRWTGQSRAVFERQYLADSFYLCHSFSVIVAQPLSFTFAFNNTMDPLLNTISLIGSITSISGQNLSTLFRQRTDIEKLKTLARERINTLAKVSEHDDQLVGYWKLMEWIHESDHLPPYIVSGALFVFNRNRNFDSWDARMALHYHEPPHGKNIRKKGHPPPFLSIYDVTFEKGNSHYEGNCHMRSKREFTHCFERFLRNLKLKKHGAFKWRGIFYDSEIQGNGENPIFKGLYRNSVTSGCAEFVFHMPQSWATVSPDDLMQY